jgi:peptide/nickel transport system permease protein
VPAQRSDDDFPNTEPRTSGSDLERFAEDSVGSAGLAVAQGSLYFSAVEAGSEGRRRGKKLGVGAWLAIGWMVFIVLIAVLAQAGALPLKSPTEPFASCARLGPFAKEGTAPGHLLGCDSNGRDMISRVAHGAYASLLVATGAVLLGFIIGGFLGMLAGYFSGKLDTTISSLFNVFLAVPAVVLALALTAFLQGASDTSGGGQGIHIDIFGFELASREELILILAIGIVSVPLLGRITRASALSWSQREFVLAARAQGAKSKRIMVREVLPNVLPAMFSIALLGIAVAIVAEGTLAILGVGVKPPTPSWGNIIALERGNLNSSPHIVFEPAILIFLTVLALNFLGDVVRTRLDVRESGI